MEFPLKIECNVNKNFTFKENIFVFFIYVCASCFDFFPLGQNLYGQLHFVTFSSGVNILLNILKASPKHPHKVGQKVKVSRNDGV